MKTIIAVVPIISYGDELNLIEPDYSFINNYCNNKKTLIAPADLRLDNLKLLTKDIDNESVYESEEFQSFFSTTLYIDRYSMIFWNKIHSSLTNSKLVHDQKNLIDGGKFFIKAISEKELVNKNFYREKYYYYKFIKQVNFLRNLVNQDESEVVITNFAVAYFLTLFHPKEFRLVMSIPNVFSVSETINDLKQAFYDYNIFSRWNNTLPLTMSGSYITEFFEKLDVDIYLLENKSGHVSGIISDKYGLAAIDGILNKGDFIFSRRYLLGTVDFHSRIKINNIPQFYSAYWREDMMHPNFIFHSKLWINNILS